VKTPDVLRRTSRFDGRREVVLGLGVYAAYLVVGQLKRHERARARARRNAERVVALERRLGLHVEPALQAILLPRRRLLAVLNVAYVTLNVALTVGWLMRLFVRRDPAFHRLRRAAAFSIAGACPVFLVFPAAPPRALDDFVDTIADVSRVDLDSGLVARLYDPLAAMPSLHLAFAVVTAVGLREASGNVVVRALAPGYPPAVALVVFVTANHYVLDAVAGTALGFGALRLGDLLERR
jgi:hypothetical protein